MAKLNVELFAKAVERIEANPEMWDQNYLPRKYPSIVPCNTPYCIAGHINFIAYGEPCVKFKTATSAAALALGIARTSIGEKFGSGWLFDCIRTIDDFKRVIETGEIPDERR